MKYRLFFMSLLALSACQETDEPEAPVLNGDEISVSGKSLMMEAEQGSTVSVEITTEGDWYLSGITDGVKQWLAASPEQGHGNATVTFTGIEFNPYEKERIAVMTFHSGDAQTSIVIRQASDLERCITLSEETLEFDGTVGQQKTITLNTTKPWMTEGYSQEVSEWLHLSATSGETGGELTVTTSGLNEEMTPREAVITFRIDRVHSAQLTVSQACGIELSLEKTYFDFSAAGNETQTLPIRCNAVTKSWVIEGVDEVQEWLSFSATSGVGDTDVKITTKSANQDAERKASFVVRVDEVNQVGFVVSQRPSVEISVTPDALVFSGGAGESKSVTVTSTTASMDWYIEGYTEDVKKWLRIDTETASALETTVNISTLGVNASSEALSATIRFHLTDDIYDELTITQSIKPLDTYVITWKAGSDVDSPTIKGGDMSPHSGFPWVDAWAGTKKFTNGKGGDVIDESASYAVTATWLFQDAVTKEWIPLEMGPIREPTTNIAVYYANPGTPVIRWAWSYIKIPAKAGYRLTHVKMTSINAASSAALVLGTDKSASNGFIEESANRVTFGKNDPLDRELSTAEAGTDYYLGCILERQIDSFEFTYTEVR